MLKFVFLLILLLASLYSIRGNAFVKDPIYDDLDGYALVDALIKDGKLDLAIEELKNPDLQKDRAKFALFMGRYYYGKGEWQKSVDELEKARQGAHVRSEAELHIARSFSQLKLFKKCASSYKNTAFLSAEMDAIWKAHCEFSDKEAGHAWVTLNKAYEKLKTFALMREIIGLQSELGLFHEGMSLALNWLQQSAALPSQYLNLAEIFHVKGQEMLSIYVLEAGRARYPMDKDINLTLSQMYFLQNNISASEEGFVRAASSDPKYYYHAAEMNRQMRNYERSQYFNGFIANPQEKLKQKIATYVDREQFSLIASMDPMIQRSDLHKDDEIKYALAYSLVRGGQIDAPLKYLSSITKPELMEKTTVLRKALIDCQEKKELCKL